MVDIRVEKKKPVWPWVLAGIVLLGIVAWLLVGNGDNEMEDLAAVDTEMNDRENENPGENRPNEEGVMGGGAVAEYITFVENEGNVGLEHEYTHQALTRLSRALDELSGRHGVDKNLEPELTKIRQQADQIMVETTSTKHSNKIRDAFTSVANVVKTIQQKSFPDKTQVSTELKNAAEKVKADKMATDQATEIKGFFDEAADALKELRGENRKS